MVGLSRIYLSILSALVVTSPSTAISEPDESASIEDISLLPTVNSYLKYFAVIERRSESGGYTHICNGALISWSLVVTSGACPLQDSLDGYRVLLGFNVTNQYVEGSSIDLSGIVVRGTDSITYSGEYKEEYYEFEVALLKLNETIPVMHDDIDYAWLAVNRLDVKSVCSLNAWRILYTSGIYRNATFVITKTADCAPMFSYYFPPTEQVCGRRHSGTHYLVAGEIGSPLICNGVLVGIRTTIPAENYEFFVDFTPFPQWIRSHLDEDEARLVSAAIRIKLSLQTIFLFLLALVGSRWVWET